MSIEERSTKYSIELYGWEDAFKSSITPSLIAARGYKRGAEGDRISESRMRTTFWHELTHAILDRMGRTDLNDSEEFVNTFSAFLSGAIDTMEE